MLELASVIQKAIEEWQQKQKPHLPFPWST
jgi:hypothetical protein